MWRRQGSNAGGGHCTTRFENAHRTVLREVLYRHHPWFGRRVCVHGAVDKAGYVVFRCTLDGSQADRWLEVPAWMFDRTACPDPGLLAAQPFVSIDGTCGAFCASRSGVEGSNAISCPAFWRIQSLSRPESGRDPCHARRQCSGSGYRHNRRSRPQQQMDLFGSGLSNGAIGAPAWPELPAEARAALTSLMTQLILDHAATTATPPAKEVDHDL